MIWLQMAGTILGMAGALWTALPTPALRRKGFISYLGSNACLITWGALADQWVMVALFSFYTVTSSLGLRSNWSGDDTNQCRDTSG